MGTFPTSSTNRKSTEWRNRLRALIARLTTVTKDDGTGLEEDIVTSATIADGAVLEAALGNASVSMAKCKFPVTGANLLSKKYSSFAALESSSPSADLYVVSGAASALTRSSAVTFLGTHSLGATISGASNLTFAFSTGSSNYPINALATVAGTYHILSMYYKRSAFSGQTFVIQLRFSDSSTQTISGTLTPTTTWQRYVSTPFTLNSTSLAYRVEIVLTGSSSRTTYFAEAMLNCTGTDANVTEVGPWIPGANWPADDVDARTVRLVTSRYLNTFASGDVILDADVTDSLGRITTLRQTSTDLAVTNIIHDDGSGLEKDNATIDLKIASGKKFTVGSQDVIDASANLALASGKTFIIGTGTVVNASGVIQARRTLQASYLEVLTGGATAKEATTVSTTYVVIQDGAVYLNANEKVELNVQLWSGAGAGEFSYMELSVNGVTSAVNATGGASAWQTKTTTVSSGSSGLLVFKLSLKSSVGSFTAKARYWVLDGTW